MCYYSILYTDICLVLIRAMKNILLRVKDFHLGYGNEEILHIHDFNIKPLSVTGLLGPSGGGKSSLLNAIIDQATSLSYWQKGEIYFNDKILNKDIIRRYISYVPQKARLYTDTVLANFLDGLEFKQGITSELKREFVEKVFKKYELWEYFENILDEQAIKQSLGIHKILLIIKAMVRSPQLLLIDEVLDSTSVKDELIIIGLIKKLKQFTTVLLITHNKEEAKDLCDSIALVSGGVLHEHTSAQQFFKQPSSEIGREFLESGSAWYLNPETQQEHVEDNLTALRRFSSICEFYWVLPNRLGGMQKPGLMTEIEDDLKIMKQLKVNVLVTLQQNPIDVDLLKSYGIQGLHFPIVDMDVPELETTHQFLLQVQPLFDQGKSLVYHCKAGMGRTGTLLACNLVWLDKISAIQAIEKIRQVNYKYIQTDEQMDFVGQFEQFMNTQS